MINATSAELAKNQPLQCPAQLEGCRYPEHACFYSQEVWVMEYLPHLLNLGLSSSSSSLMTHFPGFPCLIFQGQEEWEHAGSHAAGQLNGKWHFKLSKNNAEYFPCSFSCLPAYLRTATKNNNNACTCPQSQSLPFGPGCSASSAEQLLQGICVSTFALLHAVGCLQARLPSCTRCSVKLVHRLFIRTSFSPVVAIGCSFCLENPLSSCCWFISLPKSCAPEKLKQHISAQAPIKPWGE